MKKFQNIIVAVIIAICFFGCEKDDICPETTQTTPRLVFEFYDFNNPTVLKSVGDLRVFKDSTTPVVINEAATATDITKYIATGNSIKLPLNINAEETTYKLRLDNPNSTDTLIFDDDFITINYVSEQIYVSRACGYKTNFDLINVSQTDDINNRWIKNLIIEIPNVDTENEAHVKIYF